MPQAGERHSRYKPRAIEHTQIMLPTIQFKNLPQTHSKQDGVVLAKGQPHKGM